MSDIQLICRPHASYEEGDVLTAFNDKHINWKWAEQLCHPRLETRVDNRLLPDGLAYQFLLHTRQYRVERISRTEIRRIDLWNGGEETFGPTPNAKGEYIHVQQYIDHALHSSINRVFGDAGNEVWFGGKSRIEQSSINQIWNVIESRTAHRKSDHSHYPWGQQSRVSFLVISTDDFDDDTQRELWAPMLDANENVVKRRKSFVRWDQDLGLSRADQALARNPLQSFDLLSKARYVRSNIVRSKQ